MSNDNQNENTSSENKVPEWSMPLPALEPQNDTAVTLRWYHKTWLICITVWFSVGSLIFGIAALALVWTHPKWVTKTKWIFTAVIAVLLVFGPQIAKQDKIESENAQKLIESAESGDVDAQLKLGLAYLDGGTPKIVRNEKDAERWLKKSADNGNERAMSKLEEIEERKAEAERIAAEKEVQDIQKKEGRNKNASTGQIIKISADDLIAEYVAKEGFLEGLVLDEKITTYKGKIVQVSGRIEDQVGMSMIFFKGSTPSLENFRVRCFLNESTTKSLRGKSVKSLQSLLSTGNYITLKGRCVHGTSITVDLEDCTIIE